MVEPGKEVLVGIGVYVLNGDILDFTALVTVQHPNLFFLIRFGIGADQDCLFRKKLLRRL